MHCGISLTPRHVLLWKQGRGALLHGPGVLTILLSLPPPSANLALPGGLTSTVPEHTHPLPFHTVFSPILSQTHTR
jgi:hypothetical protein